MKNFRRKKGLNINFIQVLALRQSIFINITQKYTFFTTNKKYLFYPYLYLIPLVIA
jgi:hypothetical protein